MSLKQSNPDCFTPVRKRQALTLQAKVHIIKDYDGGEKACEISKKYLLPESTVRSILKDKKRILAAVKNSALLNASTIRNRHGIISQMESTLKVWCENQIKDNVSLTQQNVCAQALRIFESLKLLNNSGKNERFLASKGWYFRFKRRCNWNRSPNVAEESSGYDDIELIEEANPEPTFADKLRKVIEEGGYTPQTVFNIDETAIYWKKMPDNCYIGRLEKSFPGFKYSKDRMTIMLGGNAAGDFRLKPLLVYRNENPKALHGKAKGGLPVIWKSNPKACMTASIFEDWFGNFFIPEVERYCLSNGIPFNVLLIIDSAPGHPPGTLIDFDHRVRVVFLPPGGTYSIQPMHQEVVTIFKAQYTRRVFLHLNDVLRQHGTISIEQAWKMYNILDAIRIIVDSWVSVTENDWKSAWEKIFPSLSSTKNDSTEESLPEDNKVTQIIEEIVNLAAELDMKINVKDICELLESHNNEATNEELAEMQEQNANEEFDASDPLILEENMSINKLTEALGHIKLGLQIFEEIDSNEHRARNTKQDITKLLRPYEEVLNGKIKRIANQDI